MNTQEEVERIKKEARERLPLRVDCIPFLLLVIEAWEDTWGPLKMKTAAGEIATAKDFLYQELDKAIKKKLGASELSKIQN